MDKANPPHDPSAALGLAGTMGCLMAVIAIVSVLVGTWLDNALQTGHLAKLVCITAGLPLNLGGTVWLTRRLIARIIPADKPKTPGFHPGEQAAAPEQDEQD